MSQENVEIVRRAVDAYVRGDLDTGYSYLHPEIEFHTYVDSPEAGVIAAEERFGSTTRISWDSSSASASSSRRFSTPESGLSS